jgi:hypothetical protein
VQRDATLALTVPAQEVQRAADRVVAVTDRFAGIVQDSNVSTDDQGGSQANFDLLFATAQLDRALAALSSLGHVSARTQDALDITDALGSARHRLAESEAERLALLRQLARATSPSQIASIHAQLQLVAGRVSTDATAVRSLERRARYAHVQVTISERRPASSGGAGGGWTPDDALRSALGVLQTTLGVLLIALASLVPLAVVGSLLWRGAVVVRRQRRERVLGTL